MIFSEYSFGIKVKRKDFVAKSNGKIDNFDNEGNIKEVDNEGVIIGTSKNPFNGDDVFIVRFKLGNDVYIHPSRLELF